MNTLAMPTIFFFFGVTIEMIAKFQRGTSSHSNTSFLQRAANGLALCSRKGRTIIKVKGGGGEGGAKYKKNIVQGKI